MEKGTLKCKNIVQNLLGFSRDSSLSENQNIQINEILNRAILITELRTRAMGIRINVQDAGDKMLIYGRFHPLAQVFCNVLQNAYEAIAEKRKANPEFGGEININAHKEKNEIVISIEDNGIGIDSRNLEYIFDPLFTTKDPEKNAGLGLPLAKQILQDHKAQIFGTINEDRKTCFHIHFPVIPTS